MASYSHSCVSIHPLGGSKTKLRLLALPGGSIWPRFPLGAGLREDIGPSREGQFSRLILRLDNGTAIPETSDGALPRECRKLGHTISLDAINYHPCYPMGKMGALLKLCHSFSEYVIKKGDCTRARAAMLLKDDWYYPIE